nr:ABC transporter substrate-binding protein [uncultured Cohaesibacter sp.]
MVRTLICLALLVAGGFLPAVSHARPMRVVSINLCTDQLAMLVADPEQLLSVSNLALDRNSSVMVEQAKHYLINHAKAEEVIRLKPDLVLAGTHTSKNTISLLKRLGVRVELFAPDSAFDTIRQKILRLGVVLGQEDKARRIVRNFDVRLSEIEELQPKERKVLADYEPNSFTGGVGTLAHSMIKAAGFLHLGEELGLVGSTIKMPLETLIRSDPDYVMTWSQWSGGQARATQVLGHPALDDWFGPERRITVDTAHWICGGPFTLDAVASLQQIYLDKEKRR